MAEKGRLQDRVAIVTGAAKGIGAAIAERFVRDGAKVVLADIDDEAGEAQASRLAKLGSARYRHCNVAEKLDVHNMMASTLDAYGAVDILVNNAGIVAAADFLDVKEEDFDRVLAINLKGAFLCGQAAARQMVAQVKAGRAPGSIINLSSVNAVFALPNQVGYSVSKGGIAQLTKVMALSLASFGIRVNAIGPGSIMTDLLRSRRRRQGGDAPGVVAYADGPHRRSGRDRRCRRVSGERRCQLHNRSDDLCRWRPPAIELHGSGGGMRRLRPRQGS